MDTKQKELNIATIKDVLKQYLQDKGFRNTPERYTILEEIYNMEHHFNVDDLYLLMMQKKYFRERFIKLAFYSASKETVG